MDVLKYAILVILTKKDALEFLCHRKKSLIRSGLSTEERRGKKGCVVNTQMYSNEWSCKSRSGRFKSFSP